MNREERVSMFVRDLDALLQTDDAFVIFNVQGDEDSYIQFTHSRVGEPLLCEVSNRSEGWGSHSLESAEVAELRALGYEIPSPHHQSNPHKEFSGDANTLALEVERIFRNVFRMPEDYQVVSSGVES